MFFYVQQNGILYKGTNIVANKDKTEKIEGTVVDAMPNTMFKVDMDDDRQVLATLKGVLRRRYVRIFPGDRVLVEMTQYDDKRGRIIRKFKKKNRSEDES